MTVFKHESKYQGYHGQAVAYRRSEGLQPEPGWIDLDLADVKSLTVQRRDTNWRSVNGFEVPAPISIRTWFDMDPGQGAPQREILAPEGGGLAPFGDLTLTSFKNGDAQPPQVYRDVYVDESGIEEVGPQIAAVRAHDRSIVRVPLTDIRRFYLTHGAFVGDINVRLPSGEFDRETVKDFTTCEPWSAVDVIRYLFALLPGSPVVLPDSDLTTLTIDPPADVIGRGEPAVQHLDALLKRLGLVPKMMPGGNYLVDLKASSKTPLGEIATDVGTFETPQDVHYERKTVWNTTRPHAVHVFGKPVIRRVTLPYTAVFKDSDGKYYRVFDAPRRWAWSRESLLKGVAMGQEKRYRDIPPINRPQGDERREIANRDFFRLYAPTHMFAPTPGCPNSGRDGTPTEGGIDFFSEEDFDRADYLPVQDVPWYQTEFRQLSEKGLPEIKEEFEGDRENVVISPPVVQGAYFGEDLFRDFAQIEDRFNNNVLDFQSYIAGMEVSLRNAQGRLADIGRRIVKEVSDASLEGFSSDEARARYFSLLAEQPEFVQLDGDVQQALREAGVGVGEQMLKDENTTHERQARLARITREIEGWQAEIQGANNTLTILQNEFAALKATYEEIGGVPLRMNKPHTVIRTGYAIDRRTGIITFGEPVFQARDPFVLDGDTTEAVSDADIFVTLGYEVRDGLSSDLTSVVFHSVTQNGRSTPRVSGVNRSSPLKGTPVKAPKMRMYQTDRGEPMNATQVVTIAAGRAASVLNVPSVAEGRHYELIGLRKAVCEGGINSVQHVFDGTVGMTHVMHQAPSARGPLGPPSALGQNRSKTPEVDGRDALETDRVD